MVFLRSNYEIIRFSQIIVVNDRNDSLIGKSKNCAMAIVNAADEYGGFAISLDLVTHLHRISSVQI